MPPQKHSPFLDPSPITAPDSLALLHLKRDHLQPLILRSSTTSDADEIANTRFGCYPHSTLLSLPWGTQVLASNVNATAQRGRKNKKRKREDEDGTKKPDGPIVAASGFAHIVPPTPEAWTISLPHRTQVVYTPDYSYVLQRLRVRPGCTIIEAGAGSGSFTHASARAVFNGFPCQEDGSRKKRKLGMVYSFEFHEQRAQTLQKEVEDHGLDGIVKVTHRDVYQDGFTPDATAPSGNDQVQANVVFLDLPAPWLALKHLTRDSSSPLNPQTPTHLCTFSPCIEQVQRTVSTLRQTGWHQVEMVELLHKRIDVRRERIGYAEEGLRGAIPSAASVEEAVERIKEVESKTKGWADDMKDKKGNGDSEVLDEEKPAKRQKGEERVTAKQQRLEDIKRKAVDRKTWKEGRLVHRTEPEIKTHTSYLVFAVLPRAWTEEDEEACLKKWARKEDDIKPEPAVSAEPEEPAPPPEEVEQDAQVDVVDPTATAAGAEEALED